MINNVFWQLIFSTLPRVSLPSDALGFWESDIFLRVSLLRDALSGQAGLSSRLTWEYHFLVMLSMVKQVGQASWSSRLVKLAHWEHHSEVILSGGQAEHAWEYHFLVMLSMVEQVGRANWSSKQTESITKKWYSQGDCTEVGVILS